MKRARGGEGAGGLAVERGGRSGHANKCVTNLEQSFAVSSWP